MSSLTFCLKAFQNNDSTIHVKSWEPGYLVPGNFWGKSRTFFENLGFIDYLSKAGSLIEKVRLTSWVNTRVKLHSQVHFESKKILGRKKCWVEKSFNSKKFGVLSLLDLS